MLKSCCSLLYVADTLHLGLFTWTRSSFVSRSHCQLPHLASKNLIGRIRDDSDDLVSVTLEERVHH